MKRKIIIVITIILLPFAFFNGYKLKVYNDFKNYLSENYSDKTFNIGWVKYDFLNKSLVSRVTCGNDNTEFTVCAAA